MSLEDMPVVPSFEMIREAGYEGVQFVAAVTAEQDAACARLGLGKCGTGRVNCAEDADAIARRAADEGLECVTLHVGWGMEDDDEAGRLISAILEASDRHSMPLYVETHRATIFQDMWRTVQFVKRFPELRFNGDFSHWYTGLEMVYGGFEKKLAFIQPVMERVRFLHGRIGDPGCIQVDIGNGSEASRPYVTHFRQLWTACFAAHSEPMLFVPELLSWRIFYAQGPGSDRWEQSLVLCGIARECFTAAGRA